MGNIKEFIKPVYCLLNSKAYVRRGGGCSLNFDVFFMDPDLWLDMYQFSVRSLVNLSPLLPALLLQTEPEAGTSRLLFQMPENSLTGPLKSALACFFFVFWFNCHINIFSAVEAM